MADTSFADFVRELLAGFGPVAIKRMFGGAGIFADDLMFGLIVDDVIYLKVDDALKADLDAEGCGPFVWSPSRGPRAGEAIEMGYWRLPDAAMDDPDSAAAWARRAHAVAKMKAKSKPKKKARAKR